MHKRVGLVLLAACVFAAAGCQKKVDLEAARAAIRAADADWAKANIDVETFMTFLAADATILPPNEPAVTGTGPIQEWYSGMLASPGFSVSWQPTSVEVAKSGDLGYTVGTYQLHMQGPDGVPIDDHGKYVTVWKKQSDGHWKVAVDTFNSDVPMTVSSAAPADTLDTNAK